MKSFAKNKRYYFAHYLDYITLDLMPYESMTYTRILSRKLRSTQHIASLASIPLLIMLLALGSCSQQENKEQTKVVAGNDKLKAVTIPVEGMTCSACVSRVKKSLRSLDGVTKVSVSLENRNAQIIYSSEKTSPEQIAEAIDDLGYKTGTPTRE